MTKDLALLIIAEARTYGIDVPEDGRAPEDIAFELVGDAQEAFEGGAKGEAITSILAIFDNGIPKKTKMDQMYEAKELAIAKIKKERLPIPESIEGEPIILPRDISILPDPALRRLHSEFHACLARSNWLVAVEEADEMSARQIADYWHGKALKRASETADPVTGKEKKVASLEAEASGDETVREWRQRQIQHHIVVKLNKALRDTYQQSCERISREYSMREGERNS